MLAMLIIPMSIYAQDIETYYYNKDGKSVNQVFADFYRVISIPSDNNPDKLFRDFYMSGKIKGEGRYISIDPLNINNSILDGECVFYKQDGSIEKKFTMSEGKLHGTYIEFTSNGNEFIQIEYSNGEYALDWYYRANTSGAYGRFRHSDNQPIYETFDPEAQFTTWIDGIPWVSYRTNGFTISMAVEKANEYGRYHQVTLMIDNTTFNSMLIEPSTEVTAYSAETPVGLTTNPESRRVFSYDDYMQKVSNRQAWATVAMALSTAAAGISSTLSPNSASVSVNGHTAFINSYGNHVSIFSPDLAFAGVGEAWAADRRIIQKGYFKKNTISSGEIISGYFNIKREYNDYLVIKYNFNGVDIPFYWNVSGDIAQPLDYRLTIPSNVIANDPKPLAEPVLKKYGTEDYTWESKCDVSINSIKIKKKARIEFFDPNVKLEGHNYVLIDANGEHEINSIYAYSSGDWDNWVTFELNYIDVQFPFTIQCLDDDLLSFYNIEKLK